MAISLPGTAALRGRRRRLLLHEMLTTLSLSPTPPPQPLLEKEVETLEAVKLAERWREIHGEGDWSGLLDPMDSLLRSKLIRYGEMAQACYDAFHKNPFSPNCGNCKYHHSHFFESLGMPDAGYEVTSYIYTTSSITISNFFRKFWRKSQVGIASSNSANWIGFVAVSHDETSRRLGRRDIVVAWRGTVTGPEWISDLMDYLVAFPCQSNPEVKVEAGFLRLYTEEEEEHLLYKHSAREQILAEVRRLVHKYSSHGEEELSISITGHSLGAALAVLSAYDIAVMGLNKRADTGKEVKMCVFSFAGPRVGNKLFKEAVESAGVKVLRVVNVHDFVPQVPGLLVNERSHSHVWRLAGRSRWSYSHVGVELALNQRQSPFLKFSVDPSFSHNLEVHLHLLDGYHGKGKRFMLCGRDIALVNKSSNFLKDDLHVPTFWRQDKEGGQDEQSPGPYDHPSDIHHTSNRQA